MAVELEAKMAVADHLAVAVLLRQFAARKLGDHFEVNAFFDTEDRSLLAAGEGLRLRHELDFGTTRERHVITYKGPRQAGPLKSREEIEFEVSDAAAATILLERLGYVRTLSFEKRRQSWELDGCTVELDEVPYLGKFVEIEGPDEPTVMRVRERLQLSDRPLIKSSYISLLMTHLKERGEARQDVRFKDVTG
ncbi:MAG TPA: class IV adenylate cyclase [Tepidisphaeraceae bacterium]|nr:class IV adenylate cyclase [Tepidisphaeraceae bacterium]